MSIVNAFTVRPDEIKPGDEMVFVVKALVTHRDTQGKLRYRIYRCPWEGDEIPQGSRIFDDEKVAVSIFPTLARAGLPDPTYLKRE